MVEVGHQVFRVFTEVSVDVFVNFILEITGTQKPDESCRNRLVLELRALIVL